MTLLAARAGLKLKIRRCVFPMDGNIRGRRHKRKTAVGMVGRNGRNRILPVYSIEFVAAGAVSAGAGNRIALSVGQLYHNRQAGRYVFTFIERDGSLNRHGRAGKVLDLCVLVFYGRLHLRWRKLPARQIRRKRISAVEQVGKRISAGCIGLGRSAEPGGAFQSYGHLRDGMAG